MAKSTMNKLVPTTESFRGQVTDLLSTTNMASAIPNASNVLKVIKYLL